MNADEKSSRYMCYRRGWVAGAQIANELGTPCPEFVDEYNQGWYDGKEAFNQAMKSKDDYLKGRQRHTRDEVLEAARDITGKDLRDLDHGPYEVSDPTPNRCEPSCWMGCPHGVTSIRDEPALHHTPRKRFGPEGEDT